MTLQQNPPYNPHLADELTGAQRFEISFPEPHIESSFVYNMVLPGHKQNETQMSFFSLLQLFCPISESPGSTLWFPEGTLKPLPPTQPIGLTINKSGPLRCSNTIKIHPPQPHDLRSDHQPTGPRISFLEAGGGDHPVKGILL